MKKYLIILAVLLLGGLAFTTSAQVLARVSTCTISNVTYNYNNNSDAWPISLNVDIHVKGNITGTSTYTGPLLYQGAINQTIANNLKNYNTASPDFVPLAINSVATGTVFTFIKTADSNGGIFRATVPVNFLTGYTIINAGVAGGGSIASTTMAQISLVKNGQTVCRYSAPAVPSFSITSPKTTDTLVTGTDQTITWTSTGLSPSVSITLGLTGEIQRAGEASASKVVPNTGSYVWHNIPYLVGAAGDIPLDYVLQVSDSEGKILDSRKVGIQNVPTDKPTVIIFNSTNPNVSLPATTTAVYLVWTPVAGASSYNVRVDDTTKNGWSGKCTIADPANSGDLCANNVPTTITTFPVQNGHAYHFWVDVPGVNSRSIDFTVGKGQADVNVKVDNNAQGNIACTSFTYSPWGACVNNSQSRTVATQSPTGCTSGASPVLTQSCSTIANVTIPGSDGAKLDCTVSTVNLGWAAVSGAKEYNIRVDDTTAGGWSGNCASPSTGDLCWDHYASTAVIPYPVQSDHHYTFWVDVPNVNSQRISFSVSPCAVASAPAPTIISQVASVISAGIFNALFGWW